MSGALLMQNDSVFDDLKSAEMTLIYFAYGDETVGVCEGHQSHSKKVVDDQRDLITGGDRAWMIILQLKQMRNIPAPPRCSRGW